MKNVIYWLVALGLSISTSAFAQDNAAEPAKSCPDTIQVKVNGLVCDFCARALEKTFGKNEDVADIDIDLAKGRVSIAMKSGKTIDEQTLNQLITDSGYDVVAIDGGC